MTKKLQIRNSTAEFLTLNLYHHLNKNEKIVEKQLHVLVAEIQYFASRKYFNNLAEYLDYYETLATPVTCKDSIKLTTSASTKNVRRRQAAVLLRR